MQLLIKFFAILFVFQTKVAMSAGFLRGSDLGQMNTADVFTEIETRLKPGSFLVLGEIHDRQDHHDNQKAIIDHLIQKGHRVHVGMEFFEYPDQGKVESFSKGLMDEAEFLRQINWKGFPYDFYRPLVNASVQSSGSVSALNSPAWLTRKVGRQGLAALTFEEAQFLPPLFQLGRDSYRKRFSDLMGGGHVSESQMDQYFAAQSIWDDTMAHQALLAALRHPDAVIVIIVGDFHIAFGGGLLDRLRSRGASSLISVSQIDTRGMPADLVRKVLDKDPVDGPRADYIWDSF